MPTVGERLVHMGGFGDTFGAFQTEFGPMSGLICGENSNPLAVFALTAEGTRIHVMSWPNHFPTSGDPLRNRVAIDSQAFAQMSKAFVISACGTVDERMIEMLESGPDGEKFLRDPDCSGGSVIVAPNSRIIAGPMGAEEGILYADCNLEIGIQMKLRHDFAGHYNRPDIFHLQINRAAPQLYSVHGQRRSGARRRTRRGGEDRDGAERAVDVARSGQGRGRSRRLTPPRARVLAGRRSTDVPTASVA